MTAPVTAPELGVAEASNLVALILADRGHDADSLRDLDRRIIAALYPEAQVGEYVGYEDVVFHAEPLVRNKEILPFFTASLDAARTLVPAGLGVNISQHGRCGDDCLAYVGKSDSDARGNLLRDTFHAEARTMPLALCAAALKAIAGREPPKRRKKACSAAEAARSGGEGV